MSISIKLEQVSILKKYKITNHHQMSSSKCSIKYSYSYKTNSMFVLTITVHYVSNIIVLIIVSYNKYHDQID